MADQKCTWCYSTGKGYSTAIKQNVVCTPTRDRARPDRSLRRPTAGGVGSARQHQTDGGVA